MCSLVTKSNLMTGTGPGRSAFDVTRARTDTIDIVNRYQIPCLNNNGPRSKSRISCSPKQPGRIPFIWT